MGRLFPTVSLALLSVTLFVILFTNTKQRQFANAPRAATATTSFVQQTVGNHGRVVIESESFHERVNRDNASWSTKTVTTGYSGSSYLQAIPDVGKNQDMGYLTKSPELRYKIEFSKSGTYYVWVRGNADDETADSIHVGLDGVAVSSSDRMFLSRRAWGWTKDTSDKDASGKVIRASIPISSGLHTLNVYMREDGARFDKILLTTDPSYTPSGIGPDESARTSPTSSNVSSVACPGKLCSGLQGYWNFDQVVPNPLTSPVDRPNSVSGQPRLIDGPVLVPTARTSYTQSVSPPFTIINNSGAVFPFSGGCLDGLCSSSTSSRNGPYLTTQTANYPPRGTGGTFTISGWFKWSYQYFSTSTTFFRPLVRKFGDSPLSVNAEEDEFGLFFSHSQADISRTTLTLRIFGQKAGDNLYSQWSYSNSFSNADSTLQGGWNFFAAGYDGNNFKIWVNNKEILSQPWTGVIPEVAGSHLFVGGHINYSPNPKAYPVITNSWIDELGIWNRWLEPDELNKLYDCKPELNLWGCPFPFDGTVLPSPTPLPLPSFTPTPTPALIGKWYDFSNSNGGYACPNGQSNSLTTYYSTYTTLDNTVQCIDSPAVGYTAYGSTAGCSTDGKGRCIRFPNSLTPISFSAKSGPETNGVCTAQSGSVSAYPNVNWCSWMKAPGGSLCGAALIPSALSFTAQDVQYSIKNISNTSNLSLVNQKLSWDKNMNLLSIKIGPTILASDSFTSPYTLTFPASTPTVSSASPLVFTFSESTSNGTYDLTLTTKDATGKNCTVQAINYR